MSVLLKGLSKTALLTFTTFMLSACLPEEETLEQGEQTTFAETGNKSLSLPSPSLDYVSYADTDLPVHFIDGDEPVTSHDNTPNNNPITNTGATLGRVLFYDTALSINDAVSCASCHQQDTGFTDDAILSTGFQDGLRVDTPCR